uniref:Uncharacterized protein n=1 Tax=Trypanosoma congolense (strain IL3000) TaxID=1068625 RepID=G0UQM3_TRYCI|nr:conserved hypothetical protein [Trypanosoma congolense IL3000]
MLRTLLLCGAALLREQFPAKKRTVVGVLSKRKAYMGRSVSAVSKAREKGKLSARIKMKEKVDLKAKVKAKTKAKIKAKTSDREAFKMDPNVTHPDRRQRHRHEKEAERMFMRMIKEERRRRQLIIRAAIRKAISTEKKEESKLLRHYAANKVRAVEELQRIKNLASDTTAAEEHKPPKAPEAQKAVKKKQKSNADASFRRKVETEAEKKFLLLLEELSKRRQSEIQAAAALLEKERASTTTAAPALIAGPGDEKSITDTGAGEAPLEAFEDQATLTAGVESDGVEGNAGSVEALGSVDELPVPKPKARRRSSKATAEQEMSDMLPGAEAAAPMVETGKRTKSPSSKKSRVPKPLAAATPVAEEPQLIGAPVTLETEEAPTVQTGVDEVEARYETPLEQVREVKQRRQRKLAPKAVKPVTVVEPVAHQDTPAPLSALDYAAAIPEGAYAVVNQQPVHTVPISGFADAPLLPPVSPAIQLGQRRLVGGTPFDIPVIPLCANPMEAFVHGARVTTPVIPSTVALNIPVAPVAAPHATTNTGLLRL